MPLLQYLEPGRIEVGCDEAGRGCLAGPVAAAAVILPPDFSNDLLNDSKKLTERQRNLLRPIIEREALAWCVVMVSAEEIEQTLYEKMKMSGLLLQEAIWSAFSADPDFLPSSQVLQEREMQRKDRYSLSISFPFCQRQSLQNTD